MRFGKRWRKQEAPSAKVEDGAFVEKSIQKCMYWR